MNRTDISLICKALGDRNRLNILEQLAGGEMCACKLLERLKITQPTLSHHTKILAECGLIAVRKDGKWSHYSIDCKTLTEFKNFIGKLSFRKKAECCGQK